MRKAKAIVADKDFHDGGRGTLTLLLRPILNHPKDAIAIMFAVAVVAAIAGNALFMQAGRHPSPMFGAATAISHKAVLPANPIPRARPADAEAKPAESRAAEVKPAVEQKQQEPRQADARSRDPMRQLIEKTAAPGAPVASVLRPPAPIPVAARADGQRSDAAAGLLASQRRIAAVQRTLTEFGYAQLKPTGVAGSDTQAAIAKFEKERKLPVTGQPSDRVVRELAAVTGRPIE